MSARPGGRRGSAAVHAVLMVTGSSATAIGVGFVKNVLAAYYFGTSSAMDTYLVALLLPDVVMQLARTGAFNFIPLFRAERQRSEADAWQAAGKMVTYWMLLLAGILALAVVVAPFALTLVAPGFTPARRAETLELVQVLFLMAAPLGAGRILSVVLHAERRFLAAGIAEVAFQVASTVVLVAVHGIGIRALAWAQVCGACFHLLACAVALLPQRDRLRVGFDVKSTPVRRLVRLTLPVYLADSGDKLNQVVSRAFASLFRPGAISALQYAYFPVEGIHRVLGLSFSTALFPFLSSLFAQTNERRAGARLSRAVVASALLFVPASAAAWLLAGPLVVVLFERGSFDAVSTSMTTSALHLFAPAIFALALNELLGSAFHARQDTITPMRAGFVRAVTHVVLCLALSRYMGYLGLALAATVSLYLKLGMLSWSAQRLFTAGERRRMSRRVGRIVAAGLAAWAVVYPVATLWGTGAHGRRALAVLAGEALLYLGTYAAALWLLARRQLLAHVALLRRTLLRRDGRPVPAVAVPGAVGTRSARG